MDIINMRSDTQTLPTQSMREAMYRAELGDSSYGEDPTVDKLEKMAAEKLGKEEAMLVISGTMGNLVSIMAHTKPGDEVIVDPDSHIYYYEGGGLANIAALIPIPVYSNNGILDPEEVSNAIREKSLDYPVPRLLCLENTHNRSGGRVMPLNVHKELCEVAKKNGLYVHLDGARIFNAAIAAHVPASKYAEDVDSVMFCLSKGLSCPLGSVVVGSKDFIEKGKRYMKRLGGGMRQAGIIAACGIVALEQMIDRLADDHRNAKALAQGVNEIQGLHVDMDSVETNMVYVDHSDSGLQTGDVIQRLKGFDVIASSRPPTHIRLVVNRHHDSNVIKDVLVRIKRALK